MRASSARQLEGSLILAKRALNSTNDAVTSISFRPRLTCPFAPSHPAQVKPPPTSSLSRQHHSRALHRASTSLIRPSLASRPADPRTRQPHRGLSLSPITFSRLCSYHRSRARSHSATEDISGAMDISKGREVLPTNVRPIHYELTLEPNFTDFTYNGTVAIE